MSRRHFLLSAMSLLAASELHAQSLRLRRVAIAVPHASGVPNEGLVAFRKRMGELGWVEDRNIEYVFAYADGEWSAQEGWNGRALNQYEAKGVLVSALGVLAVHYGHAR